jgi:lysophospholipase L1-like esterase
MRLRGVALAAVLAAAAPAASTEAKASSCKGRAWVGAWTAPPSDATATFSDQTLRLNLTPLRAGKVARVRLSNRLSTAPVTFTRVYLGEQRSGARLVTGSNRQVTFKGSASVTVPAGREVLSDPVSISFRAFDHLAVSVYVSGSNVAGTQHAQAHQTSYMTPSGAGNRSAAERDDGFSLSTTTRPFVTEILTRAPRRDGVLVPVGDSITDGDQRSPTLQELGVDEDARYPDFLARRLIKRGLGFSVLNEGIGANRILSPPVVPFAGPSLLTRLGADVIKRRRLTDVILLEGINDMGTGATAHQVIQGIKQVVRRLKAVRTGARRKLNVLVGTLTPSGGAALPSYGTPQANARRQRINDYIRNSGIGNGYVDFDRALRDPDDPSRLLPKYNGGDWLHPSSAGYRRMAKEVDLSVLKGPECSDR